MTETEHLKHKVSKNPDICIWELIGNHLEG